MIERKFQIGDYVSKTKGSWWEGYVRGFYQTEDNEDGICVQLDKPCGPVQIYPSALFQLTTPQAPTPQPNVRVGEDGEQFVRDAIRSAYDRGYNDARNAKSVPGDSALGYRGRDMSEEIAVDVLARLSRLPPPQPIVDGSADE